MNRLFNCGLEQREKMNNNLANRLIHLYDNKTTRKKWRKKVLSALLVTLGGRTTFHTSSFFVLQVISHFGL